MITDNVSLKVAIADWLAKDTLASFIPDLVNFANNRINREIRIKEMERILNATISAGTIDVPVNYLELKNAYINTAPAKALERTDPEFILKKFPIRNADGRPLFIAREATKFIFGPFPDAAYQVKGVYYAGFDQLLLDGDSNDLLRTFPQVYLFAALAEAEPLLSNDERVALWEQKYDKEVARLMTTEKGEALSGSRPRARTS